MNVICLGPNNKIKRIPGEYPFNNSLVTGGQTDLGNCVYSTEERLACPKTETDTVTPTETDIAESLEESFNQE